MGERELPGGVRWTILTLRWPRVASQVERQPDLLRQVLDPPANGLSEELRALLDDEDLRCLLRDPINGVEPKLDQWVAAQFVWTISPSNESTESRP